MVVKLGFHNLEKNKKYQGDKIKNTRWMGYATHMSDIMNA
jgi:hypothetical protein